MVSYQSYSNQQYEEQQRQQQKQLQHQRDEPPDYHVFLKTPVDCKRLFDHCVENINTIPIPACQGIEGRIGALMADPVAHVNHMDHMDLSIDILLLGIDDAVYAASIALGNNGVIADDEEENFVL
jgi:hypothetical protein